MDGRPLRRDGPNFARLRTALFRGEPDRVPIQDSVAEGVKAAFLGHPAPGIKGEIEFRVAAGYDYVVVGPKVDFTAGRKPKEGVLIGRDAWDGRRRKWAAEHQGIITSWEDFERHPFPKPEDVDYSPFDAASRLLPEGMQMMAARGHIFTEIWELMGFETFAIALYEQPDLIAAMFDRVGALVHHICSTLAEIPNVGALRFNDDLGYANGLLVGPDVYRRYQFPWMKKIVDVGHQKSLPFIYHCDGGVMEVLDDLVAIGIDALHPIEPKPMDIREVKRRIGDKVCLMGNVPQTYPLAWGSPEDVELHVLQLLRDVAPGGGYCVGSGHSVQDYVPIENFRAMIETVLRYGQYPIDIPDSLIAEAERRAAASAHRRHEPRELPIGERGGFEDESLVT